jgi:hypothetical protein
MQKHRPLILSLLQSHLFAEVEKQTTGIAWERLSLNRPETRVFPPGEIKTTKSKQIFTLRYADRRRNRAHILEGTEAVFRRRQENTRQTEKKHHGENGSQISKK